MRLIATSDLHFNHTKSRALAEEVIDRMNVAGGDVLLVVGDTAASEGDAIELGLSRFKFGDKPKLFVAGNHELWTHGGDSYALHTEELPRRVKAMGWRWLEREPFVAGDVGIVGSVGWYDYSFAPAELGIPRRFYEHKVSPGAAQRFEEFAPLFEPADDIPARAYDVVARWNDGRYVRLGRSDEAFLDELLARMSVQLGGLGHVRHVVAAVHHLPYLELLPPPRNAQWDFAKAYLGSGRIGELLARFANVRHVLCGHSHLAMETRVGGVHAINIGSGYRWKTFRELDL
jgi:3',5'-cyclic AMP phosphodiesterase CpdA